MKGSNITLKTANFTTGGLSLTARELLREQGLATDPLFGIAHSMVIKYYNIYIHGVTILNDNGGYEFYSPSYFNKPITLFKDYITTISYQRKKKSDKCCLFLNMVDFFAYKTMQFQRIDDDKLPYRCDCILINKPLNYLNAVLEAESYDHIYSFLPLDDVGASMFKTLFERNPQLTEDMSFLYKEAGTLYSYLRATNNKEITK